MAAQCLQCSNSVPGPLEALCLGLNGWGTKGRLRVGGGLAEGERGGIFLLARRGYKCHLLPVHMSLIG